MQQRLYFERLRGQYSTITPPYSCINIENLARVYISVFLEEPEKMKSNALSIIKEYQQKKKIFNNEKELSYYFYCAILYYWFNHFLINNIISLKSKSMDMHLLMAVNLELQKFKIAKIDDKISHMSKENHATKLFQESCSFLNNQKFLFERRGFYSATKTRKLIELYKKNK